MDTKTCVNTDSPDWSRPAHEITLVLNWCFINKLSLAPEPPTSQCEDLMPNRSDQKNALTRLKYGARV